MLKVREALIVSALLRLVLAPAPAFAQSDLGPPPFDDARHSVDYWHKVAEVGQLQSEYEYYLDLPRKGQSKALKPSTSTIRILAQAGDWVRARS